ncbi:MAG: hypothetical protein JW863_06815 [Chitinispirillaceae bacterium]|nr:hypothetical protein [Chitinispirillaceae bacterium]
MKYYTWLSWILTAAVLSSAEPVEPSDTAAAPVESAATEEDTITLKPDTSASDAATGSTPAVTVSEKDTVGKNDIVVLKENLDTVFIFDKSVFRHVAKDWRNNIDIFRQRGYGASGSSYYGASAVSIRPVEELAEHLPSLANKKFHFSRFGFEPFLMSGGAGFVGLGDGFRLGGVGMSGERRFSSVPFSGDSVLVLRTRVSYGGFLIEKCMLRDKWNLSMGGLLGGSSIKVAISEQTATAFWNEDDDPFSGEEQYNHQAVCFMVEPHCGLTYTIFHFFHLGARVSLPMFMSLDKFGVYTNDFFSVNPGFQISLTFGNLG